MYKCYIHIKHSAGPEDQTAYYDQGYQPYEFALHHLADLLERFRRDGNIFVEEIDDLQLTLSYNEGSSRRVRVVYSGGPISHLSYVALCFVALTGAGSDEVKKLVRREKRKNRRVLVP